MLSAFIIAQSGAVNQMPFGYLQRCFPAPVLHGENRFSDSAHAVFLRVAGFPRILQIGGA
jgi:hypothetical protein